MKMPNFFTGTNAGGRCVFQLPGALARPHRSLLALVGSMPCATVIVTICFVALMSGCRSGLRPVASIANDLRHTIPAGWDVSTSNALVRIRSKSDLTMILQWQLPVSADSAEETLHKYGETRKYEVALSFVPRLSDSELEHLREERRPYEQALRGSHITNVTQSLDALEQIPLPTYYTDDYSIFVDRPILNGDEYPAAKQVQQLMDSFKTVFHEY